MDNIPELSLDVLGLRIGYLVIRVERNIDHEHWDVQLFCQVFVPFDHAVTDVVTAKYKVRHRHILLRSGFQFCISKGDTCICADIVGVALALCLVTHSLTAASCCNTSCLVFRVADIQSKGLRNFYREVAGTPANHLSAFFGLHRITVSLCRDLAQLKLC